MGYFLQDPLENPRDFLDTKLTAFGSRSTRIPEQSDEFGAKLTEAASRSVLCEDDTSPECEGAADEAFALFDSTMGFLKAWGSDSLLDLLNVTPAFRVGLDSVSPSSLTPRALAGDYSSYMRVSGELSLWIPLGARVPLALTLNYRHYREISPSDIVELGWKTYF